MSEQRSGGDKGGFGPKKPKATFGDVMLGIRAGQGGQPERTSSERRPDRPPRSEPGPAKERGPRRRRGGGKPPAPKAAEAVESAAKPPGPVVVIRKATGAVETRPLEPSGPVHTAEPEGPTEAEAPKETPVAKAGSVSDEVAENESFAQMYEASAKHDGGRRHFRIGEKVQGTIFQLGADTAFVSIGGKSEAMIELRELKDEEGILRKGVGDTVEAFVVEAGAKGIVLSKAVGKGLASMAMLSEARASGTPVEGLVLSVNKGGVEVAVGDVRAFCPISQLDVRFVEKPEHFVGEKLKFKVTEARDRKVVLSRRAILEAEQKAQAEVTRKSLAQGAVVRGKVTSLRDFGAFVDLGGIEGLIPLSELAHTRVRHPGELLQVGDEVEVEILKLEPASPQSPDKAKHKERITLSMRSRQEDPWKTAAAELKEGSKVKGKVVRLQPFGAFVELRPGVDGLIHVSALSNRRVAHPKDVVKVGQEVDVLVEKVEPSEKRISLRLVAEDGAAVEAGAGAEAVEGGPPVREAKPRVGQVVSGKVDRIEPYGVFLAFPGGKGLVPASETGTERGTDLKRHYSLGQELTAQVIEIEGGGKIRLSLTAAKRAEERADMEAWKKSQKPAGGGTKGFGTFADLLKGRKL